MYSGLHHQSFTYSIGSKDLVDETRSRTRSKDAYLTTEMGNWSAKTCRAEVIQPYLSILPLEHHDSEVVWTTRAHAPSKATQQQS